MISSKKILFGALVACFFVSVFVAVIVFAHIGKDEFFIVHDQQIYLSEYNIAKESFTRTLNDGGTNNVTPLAVSFPTLLFYNLFLSLHVGLKEIQFILFITSFFLYLYITFIGFFKLYSQHKISIRPIDVWNVALVTCFYCFNIYLVESINTGPFWSINYILTFSSFPVIVYFLEKFLDQGALNTKEIIIFSIITAVSSSFIIYFVPIVLFCIIYTLVRFPLSRIIKINIKKLSFFLILFALLFYNLGVYLVDNQVGSQYQSGLLNSTASLQKGGIFSMLYFNYSWALQLIWSPRNILTYGSLYTNAFFYSAVSIMYIYIIYLLIKKSVGYRAILVAVVVLLIGVFIGKGLQYPFGYIYQTAIANLPLLYVIRSPAGKMGLTILFSLSYILLFHLIGEKRSKLFYISVIIYISLFAAPFFSGEAVIGKKVNGTSGDFITSINSDYKEVTDILNNEPSIFNVLSFPTNGFVTIYDPDHDIYIGPDKLEKLSKLPFLTSNSSNRVVSEYVKEIKSKKNFTYFKDLNIKYVVLSKNGYDIPKQEVDNFRTALTTKIPVRKLIDNPSYELYEVTDKSIYKQRVYVDDENVTTNVNYVSPVEYTIQIHNISQQEKVVLLESYNKYLNLYLDEYKTQNSTSRVSAFAFLLKKQILNSSHTVYNKYANQWTIDPIEIKNSYPNTYYKENGDGSIDMKLTIFYIPQAYFNLVFLISSLTLISCVGFLFIKKIKH